MLNQNQTNGMPFESYINRVLEAQNFGVGGGSITVNSVTGSEKFGANQWYLSIPYAGQTLEWTVIFDPSCRAMGPDFEFNDDSFMADPDVDFIERWIPSLADWNAADMDSLLKVLLELTRCYKITQVHNLSDVDQRLWREHEMIVDGTEIQSDDVEVILLPSPALPTEARFYVRLSMDFSRLLGNKNCENDNLAMLQITFQQPNWNRVTPQLFLAKSLDEYFGGDAMKIPPYHDTSAIEYITRVKKALAVQIDEIATRLEKRRNLIAGFLGMQRHNVVEYDAKDFNRITLLLEQKDFFFLVHFRLLPNFPVKQPEVTLQSIYHMNSGNEVLTMKVHNIPYSPRWPTSEMITKILTKIMNDDARDFQGKHETAMNRRL